VARLGYLRYRQGRLDEAVSHFDQVLRLIAQGLSDQEIAEQLTLSQHTVHRHLSNILGRLDVGSSAAAITYAMREDLL